MGTKEFFVKKILLLYKRQYLMVINLPSRLFTCNIQADNEAGSNVLYT